MALVAKDRSIAKDGAMSLALTAARKASVAIAATILVADIMTAPPAQAQFLPDLTVSIAANTSRVAVNDSLLYVVTARNVGRSPCNWLNVTLNLPDEVELVGFLPGSPLVCGAEGGAQVCRANPLFLLGSGQSVAVRAVAMARRAAAGVTATAIVDPGNRCFEGNEGNNTATSAPVTLIERPRLAVRLNKPDPLTTRVGRGEQIFPVTITNIGTTPAVTITLTFNYTVPPRPELINVYKGVRVPEGQPIATPLTPVCLTENVGRHVKRSCPFQVTLQPREQLQARFRFAACPSPAFPHGYGSDIDITTNLEAASPAGRAVHLHDACSL